MRRLIMFWSDAGCFALTAKPGVTSYDLILHPDFRPDFEHPQDLRIKQLPIYDIGGTLASPWVMHKVLVEGAFISATVNLVVWV
jgi:hypothetical protein